MRYPPRRAIRFAVDLPEGDDASCPPLSDPRWVGWTRQLLRHLARPRTWARLARWAQLAGGNETVLRHMLAVLEHRGEARSTFRGTRLVWRGISTGCAMRSGS